MTDQPTGIPAFIVGNLAFHCWTVADGKNELGLDSTRLEWRTPNARGRVARNVGAGTCWASADGAEIGRHFPTLRAAMLAVAMMRDRRQAA